MSCDEKIIVTFNFFKTLFVFIYQQLSYPLQNNPLKYNTLMPAFFYPRNTSESYSMVSPTSLASIFLLSPQL